MSRLYPMTMRLALVENGPSFEALVDRAINEQFGAAAGAVGRAAGAVAGTIGDYVVDLWREGASPIIRALKLGLGTTQHGNELKLMRKLPAWFEQANEVKERVLVWQEKLDKHLRQTGARVSGGGWAGIDPELVAELPPTWRARLADLLIGNVEGMEKPSDVVAAVEKLFEGIVQDLTKLLARSPEAKKAITDVGFERHMGGISDALESMREASMEAAVEAKKLAKMSKADADEQFVAMANDLIDSINTTMESAQTIAVGLVDVLREATEEVPARAQRNTSLVPFGAGSRTFPGYRPGAVLRREYQQASEAE